MVERDERMGSEKVVSVLFNDSVGTWSGSSSRGVSHPMMIREFGIGEMNHSRFYERLCFLLRVAAMTKLEIMSQEIYK